MPPRGHARRGQRNFAQRHAADLPRVSGDCRRPRPPSGHRVCRCVACRTESCIRTGDAARWDRGARTAARRFSAWRVCRSTSSAGSMTTSSAKCAKDLQRAGAGLCAATAVRVKRLSVRDQSSRWARAPRPAPCRSHPPAADPGAATCCWIISRARGGASVEMNHSARFWRAVGKVCDHVERAKTGSTPAATICTATASRISGDEISWAFF